MNHYEIAVCGRPLAPLTYRSPVPLPLMARVEVSLGGRLRNGYVVKAVEQPDFSCEEAADTGLFLPEDRLEIARFIADYYVCALGEALELFLPFSRTPEPEPVDPKVEVELSQEQEKALTFLREHPAALLFGDTGSGKTEIYIRRMEEVLKEGKSAVMLMPEISLTPQIEQRLKAHFGEMVAIWHSKITKKKKEKILAGLADGSVRIVAGARSALFLPVANLGLIVVDEEHDDSYKAGNRPRYNAKDVAVLMGNRLGVPVVLGSATPSLPSYEKFPVFRLKGQFFAGKRHFVFRETPGDFLDLAVIDALKQTVAAGKQAIVFVPTRANFKYLVCDHCGKTVECPFCSVGMSLHRSDRRLKCHYCNYMTPIPKTCPSCDTGTLAVSRMGTAEITEQLRAALPDTTVETFDRDAVTTDGKLKKLLAAFNDNEIQVLVGTQMLSKGHNYHDVALAVILGLDNILALPDYRNGERAMSLLLQIAGRAGRKEDARVIVQTMNGDFFKPYLNNYQAFLEKEKEGRKDLYPPFRKFLRILFAHANGAKARDAAARCYETMRRLPEVEVVGFGECAIEKIAGKYRFNVLLRSASAKALLKAAHLAKEERLAEVDMDPLQFS